jgi:hypothetical protein
VATTAKVKKPRNFMIQVRTPITDEDSDKIKDAIREAIEPLLESLFIVRIEEKTQDD